eukprot:1292620-Amphidinium_carterae.1
MMCSSLDQTSTRLHCALVDISKCHLVCVGMCDVVGVGTKSKVHPWQYEQTRSKWQPVLAWWVMQQTQVDNAFFWRDETGTVQVGLLDWGVLGCGPVANALQGCISGAQVSGEDSK